jgi:hypothetical protein
MQREVWFRLPAALTEGRIGADGQPNAHDRRSSDH